MTEERLTNNLRFAKEKIRELENERNLLQSDNENLRSMLKSLQEKFKNLTDKFAKIQNQQNFSFLDLKMIFGANEKNLSKTRLIDEINEAINKINKKMLRQNAQYSSLLNKKEYLNQIIGTDIKNVAKEICYRVEHGDGILVNQEI